MADQTEQAREQHLQAVWDEEVRQARELQLQVVWDEEMRQALELYRQAAWNEEMRQLNDQYQEQVQATLELVDRILARSEQVQESVHSLQDRMTNFRAAAALMQMGQDPPARETTPCPCADWQNISR